jgi:hypothetical protein
MSKEDEKKEEKKLTVLSISLITISVILVVSLISYGIYRYVKNESLLKQKREYGPSFPRLTRKTDITGLQRPLSRDNNGLISLSESSSPYYEPMRIDKYESLS